MLEAVQDCLLSLIFPQKCQICSGDVERRADGAACTSCWETTRLFDRTEMLCGKCGAFLGDDAATKPVFCHRCDEHAYDNAYAVGIYEKALAANIIGLKTQPFLASRIKHAITSAVDGLPSFDVDVVVPVPLSVQRQKERGFNQAEVIGRLVGKALGLPIDASSLARTVHTPIHRTGMDQKARELTVRKAFEVMRPRLIESKNIVLVDDVLTSGSTASACANVLKNHGAGRVTVFTLARAVPH